MDFISSLKGFLTNNFTAIGDAIDSVSSSCAENYIEKLLCSDSFLFNLGIPFIVRESSIDQVKIRQKSWNSTINCDTVYIQNADVTIEKDSLSNTPKYTEINQKNICIIINKLTIKLKFPNYENDLKMDCSDVTVKLGVDDANEITVKEFKLLDKYGEILNMPDLLITISRKMSLTLDTDTINLRLSTENFKLFHSFMSSKPYYAINFRFNTLNMKMGSSGVVIMKNVSIKRGLGLSFIIEKIYVNISSFKFNVTNVVLTNECFSIDDIETSENILKFEKLNENKLVSIDLTQEVYKVNIVNLRLHVNTKQIHAISKVFLQNYMFDTFLRFLVSFNFDITKFTVEFAFKVDNTIIYAKNILHSSQVNYYNDTYIETMCYIDPSMPIYDRQNIRIQYKNKLTITLCDQKLSLYFLYPEITPCITCLKRLRNSFTSRIFSRLFPKFSFHEVSIYLCLAHKDDGKKPLFDICASFEKFELIKKSENVSLLMKSNISVYAINYQCSDRDDIITSYSFDVMLPLSGSSLFSRIGVKLIIVNLSHQIIQSFMNFCANIPIPVTPLLFVTNDYCENVKMSGNNNKPTIISPSHCFPFNSSILSFHIEDKEFNINVSQIRYPLMLSKNCILSVTSEMMAKYVHLSSVYIVQNDTLMQIHVYSKKMVTKSKIATAMPSSRHPMPLLESGDMPYILCTHENKMSKCQTFKLQEGTFPYLVDGDSPILIHIYKDKSTRSTIIHFRPGLCIVNNLPYPAIITFGKEKNPKPQKPIEPHCEKYDPLYLNQSKVLMNITIPSLEGCTGMCIILIDTEDHEETQYFLIENYGILNVDIKKDNEVTKVIVSSDIIILNNTLWPLSFVSRDNVFDVLPNKLIFSPSENLFIEYNRKRYQVNINFHRGKIIFDDDKMLFTYYRIKNSLTKYLYVQNLFLIQNLLPKEIKFGDGHMCQKFKSQEFSPLSFNPEESHVAIEYDGYCSAGNVYIGSEMETTIQLYNDDNDKAIALDIVIELSHQTRIVKLMPVQNPPLYTIINDTQFEMFAQQLESRIPFKILPFSSSTFAFDMPTESANVVLTIEGIMSTVSFFTTMFNVKFPAKIQQTLLFTSVYSINARTRAIIVATYPLPPPREVSIALEIPKVIVNFVEDQRSIAAIDVNHIGFRISSSSQSMTYSARLEVDNIQVDDHLQSTIIMKKNTSLPLIDIEMSMSHFPFTISQITSLINHKMKIDINISDFMLEYFDEIYRLLSNLDFNLSHSRIFLGHSYMESISLKSKFENEIPKFLEFYNEIPTAATVTFSIPKLSFDHFSAPASVLRKILYDTIIRCLMGKKSINGHLLPFSSCSSSREERDPKTIEYSSAFTGFPVVTKEVGFRLKFSAEMKVKAPDPKEPVPTTPMETIISTPKRFISNVIRNSSCDAVISLCSDTSKKENKRGQIKHIFDLPNKIVVAIFERTVVVKDYEKESEYSISKMKVVERDFNYISAITKSKGPLFKLKFDDEISAEMFKMTLESVMASCSINYYL